MTDAGHPPVTERVHRFRAEVSERLRPDRRRLASHGLIMGARRRALLDDFGPGRFRDGLDVLVQALDDEAELHPLGRRWLRAHLVGLLGARLRIQDWVKKHPFVRDEQIVSPIVVTGLPRTGGSLLSLLLHHDPVNRAPQYWEASDPAPPPELAAWREDPRLLRSIDELRRLARRGPRVIADHPVAASLPSDCSTFLGLELTSMHFETMAWVPSYRAWRRRADFDPAYDIHRLVLQILQSTVPTERWVLKSSTHLWHLPELLRTYPDARVVWLHRDPAQAVASATGMTAAIHALGTDAVDLRAIAASWLTDAAAGVADATAARSSLPPGQVFDLPFLELIDDPVGSVERIYHHFDLDLAPLGRYRMDAWMVQNGSGSRGEAGAGLDDAGLGPDLVRDRFRDYIETFHVPIEQKSRS